MVILTIPLLIYKKNRPLKKKKEKKNLFKTTF